MMQGALSSSVPRHVRIRRLSRKLRGIIATTTRSVRRFFLLQIAARSSRGPQRAGRSRQQSRDSCAERVPVIFADDFLDEVGARLAICRNGAARRQRRGLAKQFADDLRRARRLVTIACGLSPRRRPKTPDRKLQDSARPRVRRTRVYCAACREGAPRRFAARAAMSRAIAFETIARGDVSWPLMRGQTASRPDSPSTIASRTSSIVAPTM